MQIMLELVFFYNFKQTYGVYQYNYINYNVT